MLNEKLYYFFFIAKKKLETAAAEDECEIVNGIDEMSLAETLRPAPGGPFSALTPSMWPQEILAKLAQPEVSDNCYFQLQEFKNLMSPI